MRSALINTREQEPSRGQREDRERSLREAVRRELGEEREREERREERAERERRRGERRGERIQTIHFTTSKQNLCRKDSGLDFFNCFREFEALQLTSTVKG